MLRIVTGGGTLSSTPVSSGLWTGCACNRAEKPSGVQDLYPRPWRESGFAYGRNEVSPDSEQIEHVIAEQFMRNSVSVEQIQDGLGRGGKRLF